ncbi:phage head morphogenesis protein [Virgibacillus kimchii]
MAPKVPKGRFPTAAAVQYRRKLVEMIDQDRKKLWDTWNNQIRPLIHEYRRRMDSVFITDNNELEEIEELLELARRWSAEFVFTDSAIKRIANQFVELVNITNRSQFQEQVKSVTGIDPIEREPWLKAFMASAVKENVDYIKSIEKELHDKVQTVIIQGVRRGKSINEMGKEIRKVSDVSKARAKFIARDQAGSIHGDMTKTRHEQMGLKKFVWSTSDDEKVRDSHAELDGKTFTWKDGANGLYPAIDYGCRCSAEPDEDELFNV